MLLFDLQTMLSQKCRGMVLLSEQNENWGWFSFIKVLTPLPPTSLKMVYVCFCFNRLSLFAKLFILVLRVSNYEPYSSLFSSLPTSFNFLSHLFLFIIVLQQHQFRHQLVQDLWDRSSTKIVMNKASFIKVFYGRKSVSFFVELCVL